MDGGKVEMAGSVCSPVGMAVDLLNVRQERIKIDTRILVLTFDEAQYFIDPVVGLGATSALIQGLEAHDRDVGPLCSIERVLREEPDAVRVEPLVTEAGSKMVIHGSLETIFPEETSAEVVASDALAPDKFDGPIKNIQDVISYRVLRHQHSSASVREVVPPFGQGLVSVPIRPMYNGMPEGTYGPPGTAMGPIKTPGISWTFSHQRWRAGAGT